MITIIDDSIWKCNGKEKKHTEKLVIVDHPEKQLLTLRHMYILIFKNIGIKKKMGRGPTKHNMYTYSHKSTHKYTNTHFV